MPFTGLQHYIALLESEGELIRIDAPVDPLLEIAAITDKVCKMPGGGKALLFSKPRGSIHAAATNLFGSELRVCRALGIGSLDDLAVKTGALLDQLPLRSFLSLDMGISSLADFVSFSPVLKAADRPFEEIDHRPVLQAFPFLQGWPEDGGATGNRRYITLPVVMTPASNGQVNCGVYRLQLHGTRNLAVRWHPGSGGAAHFERFRNSGEEMPVAIVIGGDPALLFASIFPLPGNLDELTFAGYLRGKSLDLVPCSTVPLHVPHDAELVIEGYVSTEKTLLEGPFGNHTGRYARAEPAPSIRVTCVSHREKTVIPSTVVGPPPMEDCWMMKAWERILLGFLKHLHPEISDIAVPFEWTFHNSLIISLEKPRNGMVENIVSELWKLPWFKRSKLMLFVDSSIKPSDISSVAWNLINNADWNRHIIRDPVKRSGRIAADATGWLDFSTRLDRSSEVSELIRNRWNEYGFTP